MKNFLAKKWLGPLFLLLYTIGISLFLVQKITPFLKEAFPVITQEAANFLPITIHNGEVVKPENTVIRKTYTVGENETFSVILDTRTDTLDLNTLPNDGIYLSKKCLYIVSPGESKVRCLDPVQSPEPFEITTDMVKNLMDKADKYADTFLGAFLIIFSFVGSYLIILFYTIIMHWIIALLFKTTFGQTLFINTLAYMGCGLLETISPFKIGFLMKIVLFVCINWIICKNANEKK